MTPFVSFVPFVLFVLFKIFNHKGHEGRASVRGADLALAGEIFADAADGIALAIVEGEEFETVAKSLAIADNGAHLDGIGCKRQGNVQGNDLAGVEAAGERGAEAILSHLGGASPAGAEFSGLKHFDLEADIDGKAGIAACKLGLSRRAASGWNGC